MSSVAVGMLVTCALPAQTPYSSPELGLAMTLPAEFLAEGADPLRAAKDIACFIKLEKGADPWVRLCIEKMGGGVPKDAREIDFAWNGQQLEGYRFTSEWDRGGLVDITAVVVPLRTADIWLIGMTKAGFGAHAQTAVVQVLTTLQAESGGLSREQRMEKLGEGFGQIAGIIIAIGVGMWLMKRRLQKRE